MSFEDLLVNMVKQHLMDQAGGLVDSVEDNDAEGDTNYYKNMTVEDCIVAIYEIAADSFHVVQEDSKFFNFNQDQLKILFKDQALHPQMYAVLALHALRMKGIKIDAVAISTAISSNMFR